MCSHSEAIHIPTSSSHATDTLLHAPSCQSLRREVMRSRIETSLVSTLAHSLEDELIEKTFACVSEAQKVRSAADAPICEMIRIQALK